MSATLAFDHLQLLVSNVARRQRAPYESGIVGTVTIDGIRASFMFGVIYVYMPDSDTEFALPFPIDPNGDDRHLTAAIRKGFQAIRLLGSIRGTRHSIDLHAL